MASEQPLWIPSRINETNIEKFRCFVNQRRNLTLETYHDLHSWSVSPNSADNFWADAFDFLEMSPGLPQSSMRVRENTNNNALFPPQRYFPDVKMNVSELLLRYDDPEETAIIFTRESEHPMEIVSKKQLHHRVERAADAMRTLGVVTGERIAAIMSNSVETIVIALAALSIGAIFSSTSPDMGVGGILERLRQTSPKLVFADNGYIYGGKEHNVLGNIADWSSQLAKEQSSTLQNVVIVDYISTSSSIDKIERGLKWMEFLQKGKGRLLKFEQVPFSHPAFILYSSGTTGAPKCICHSGAGVALKVKVDSQLGNDLRKGDTFFQYTTTSWVMWVLNVMNLSTGATMLLYDGSPFHPTPDILIKLSKRYNVTHFGTSPRYLSELKRHEIMPKKLGLESLRIVTSTGASLPVGTYTWFYKTGFNPKVQLISMSGGTDIAGCFVGGTPTLPVFAGEIQAKSLGMAVDICDPGQEKAVSIEDTGASGELVCSMPFPSQPLFFWGDVGNKRYEGSYFERFGHDVWRQGDFCEKNLVSKGINMLGRSDGVLNPSGVRFGSAEIYAAVEHIPDILDTICIGQQRPKDENETVVLFVKMANGHRLSKNLKQRISSSIAETLSRRHVPRYIFEVPDIPYTVNGKKCEINVKQIICGRPQAVSATIANPESLDHYTKFLDIEAVVREERAYEAKL